MLLNNRLRQNLMAFLVVAMLMPMVGRQFVYLMGHANSFCVDSKGSIDRNSHLSFGKVLHGFNCLSQDAKERIVKLTSHVVKSLNFPETVSFSRATAMAATAAFGKADVSSAGPIPLRI